MGTRAQHMHLDVTGQPTPRSRAHSIGWQRAENTTIALAIIVTVAAWGQPWWMLLLAFPLFDLSMLGHLGGQRAGTLTYNMVHNYIPPATATALWSGMNLIGVEYDWPILVAASWGFHVAVDRALGFGLKEGAFSQTHLGVTGKDSSD